MESHQRCKECRRFPLRAYEQRLPRQVQTGGGRGTQLVSLGRLLLFGQPGRPVVFLVATRRWPPAAALPVWTFCSAQYLGKTATLVPSRWSFARRHMLGTGELMWTSVKRVGTRRINPSLVPGTLLGVSSPSLRGPPAAGRQRVFVGASSLCRRMFSRLPVVACHCGGTGDRGLFAPQSSCPRFSLGAGVTPAVHLPCSVSNAILTIRKVPGWHVAAYPGATEVAVRAWLAVLVTLGPPCSDDPVSSSGRDPDCDRTGWVEIQRAQMQCKWVSLRP